MKSTTFFMGDHKRDILFALVIFAISILVFFIPIGFKSPYPAGASLWAKARILSTNNSMVKTIGLSKYDSKQMEIEIVSGPFQGRRLSAINNILDKKEMDKFLSPDDNPFVVFDHYQLDAKMLLFAAVILVLVVFTRWIGFKALISFICSTAFIIKVLLHLVLNG